MVFRKVDSVVETDAGKLDISSLNAVVVCVELSPKSLLLERVLVEDARKVEESLAATSLVRKDSDNEEEGSVCARLEVAVFATDVAGLVSLVVELEADVVSTEPCGPVDVIVTDESWDDS